MLVTILQYCDFEVEMTAKNGNSPDVLGKVFVVRRQGLRECMVCGELFRQHTAPAHSEVNCYPAVELRLLKPDGGKACH
jgi:hypothetical protein